MSEGDRLLNRIADIAERPRKHADWMMPEGADFAIDRLDDIFEYHSDPSLRQVAQLAAHMTRSVSRLAGTLNARTFVRLCIDLSFYLGDELVDRIREGAVAGKLASELANLQRDEAETPPGVGSAADAEARQAREALATSTRAGADDAADDEAVIVSRSGSSFVSHAILPLAAGLIVGAAAAFLLGRRRDA